MTRFISSILPGVALCTAVAAASMGVQALEERTLGHPYVEALVFAILIGMGIRTVVAPSETWRRGIAFSAKELLEVAVVLLGASVSFATIAASGPLLLGSIVAIVFVTLGASYLTGRTLGLSPRLSMLIACGNSICGNSAIAAVAPVIGADGDDVACSISFTAVLGVLVVLGLPLLIPLLQLSSTQYGILAGLTVYAVPQVLAATVPAGLASTQIGTLVKLMRVLMLGPVVLFLSLIAKRFKDAPRRGLMGPGVPVFGFVPWFILAFLSLAALRSFDLVPAWIVHPTQRLTFLLTVTSMAALGLGVDVRILGRVGGRVTAAVTISLVLLLIMSLGLTHFFP